jgi:diacylglycerol kinase family enzyme
MRAELAVLANPNAGALRRDPTLLSRLRTIAEAHGAFHITEPTTLCSLARELCRRGVDLCALVAGDGGAQSMIHALVVEYATAGRSPPRIALLRGGTVNTIARNFAIVGTPDVLLRRLADAIDRGALPTVTQRLLAVDGQRGFLFAAALGARFLQLYYDGVPSPARALRLAARVASSAAIGGALARRLFRPASVTLTHDDSSPLRFDARVLIASTIREVGVGLRMCPRAFDADRFELVASGMPPTRLARRIPAVLAGRTLDGSPHLDVLCARATLLFDEDEPYTLDGELYTARQLTIERAEPIEIVRA